MAQNNNRIIVVTGGSRGIGRAICLAFADPETHIFFNYCSDEAAAEETEALVSQAGGTASGTRVNIVNEQETTAFFKNIISEYKHIDVLVNNAGIARDALLVMMKEKDWDDVINVNLKGTFNCCKLAGKQMLRQRYGRIINITSVIGAMGNAGQANYAASKAGIIGLTKSLAKELAPRGVTVNAIAPGYIETDMTAAMNEKAREKLKGTIPLGRLGTPEDVASTVKFLTSEGASYVTGQIIHVNGGMYI